MSKVSAWLAAVQGATDLRPPDFHTRTSDAHMIRADVNFEGELNILARGAAADDALALARWITDQYATGAEVEPAKPRKKR
jgi:hypothetical protein